ncbi:response regulator [Pseudokordiimonas caeni]|uniref:response regulator n=1 Tax=Pseudokordiimonas caeni TaxID=2997908 RepID=UPI002811A16F|nr:response regulator [Pseudokordiimonas caeni]
MESLEPVEVPRYPEVAKRSCRVLVAEDNKINQALIRRFLELGNFEVNMVSNGFDAIDAVRFSKQPFDLVLMDIKMPGMSGVEAAEGIRSIEGTRGNVCILAFTANVSDDDMEQYLNVGIDGVIGKPISREALFSAIEKAMESKA